VNSLIKPSIGSLTKILILFLSLLNSILLKTLNTVKLASRSS
jgi:hypothetical protein